METKMSTYENAIQLALKSGIPNCNTVTDQQGATDLAEIQIDGASSRSKIVLLDSV